MANTRRVVVTDSADLPADTDLLAYDAAQDAWGTLPSGTWTAAFDFATTGDLSVAYSAQVATYVVLGPGLIFIRARVAASSFSHSTASGRFRITGLPFTVAATGRHVGAWYGDGWTSARPFIQSQPAVGTTYVEFPEIASAGAINYLTSADIPSGGTPEFAISAMYEV